MISNKFSLSWQDAGKALVLTLITAFVATTGQSVYAALLAGDWNSIVPTKEQLLIGLKAAVTAGISYLGKNFFSDTAAQAEKTIVIAQNKAEDKAIAKIQEASVSAEIKNKLP